MPAPRTEVFEVAELTVVALFGDSAVAYVESPAQGKLLQAMVLLIHCWERAPAPDA